MLVKFLLLCLIFICLPAFATEPAWHSPYQQVKIKDKYVIIVEHKNGYGEKEAAQRIKQASDHLGWQVIIVDDINTAEGIKLLKDRKPDFVLTTSITNLIYTNRLPCKHYLSISAGVKTFFKKHWLTRASAPKAGLEQLDLFDGFGFMGTKEELEPLKNYVQSKGKKFFATKFYFSTPAVLTKFSEKKYHDPRLYFSGALWDKLRRSSKYQEVYKHISDQGYTDFYGPAQSWQSLRVNWLGELPNDGHSYLDKITTYPVALILHSKRHLQFSIPTSRIFEAAGAGNLIISDRHHFIEENFHNSVLYINESASASDISEQIDSHMRWIRQNPARAMQMAQQAQQIFLDHFTLEQSLINLAQMHEAVLANEKGPMYLLEKLWQRYYL